MKSVNKSKQGQTITPKKWDIIRCKYERGESPNEIAQQYGVHACSIVRRAKTEQWMLMTESSKQNLEKAAKRAFDLSKTEEESDNLHEAIKLLAVIEFSISEYCTFIENLKEQSLSEREQALLMGQVPALALLPPWRILHLKACSRLMQDILTLEIDPFPYEECQADLDTIQKAFGNM